MAMRWPFVIFSAIITIVSLVSIFTKGFNYGVDFAGGVQMVLRFEPQTQMTDEKLRSALGKIGLDASVQNFGTAFEQKDASKPKEYIIHFSAEFADPAKNSELLKQAFAPLLKDGKEIISSFRFSGFEKAFFSLSQDIPAAEVEAKVRAIKFQLLEVDTVEAFGPARNREYEIRFREVSNKFLGRIATELNLKAGSEISLLKVDFVGAKVGDDLKWGAILSTLITLLLIFLYIFIRFDMRYAPGGVISLAHDVIIVAGVFSIFSIEFDLTVVAALLTLAGFSINDTVVIFDRIREIAPELKGKKIREIIDIALNKTLSRTIITSLTVLMASTVLWIFGGPVIHNFAFALTFGICFGVYSTVFIACASLLWFYEWEEKRSGKGASGKGSGKSKAQAA